MADDEAMLLDAMVCELAAHEAPIEFVLRPSSALTLAGLLQLALRHPKISPENARVAVTLIEHVRAYFAECPAILEVLRRGADPTQDC